MKAAEALEIVKQAWKMPVETWPGYFPSSMPLAIYDDDALFFLNHPSPPPERPEQLVAATCLEINGAKTATIPAEMCPDAQALIPLAYHECFHVYQEIGHFQFSQQFDFFRALAFYPELDGPYRALCHAEAQIYNDVELTPQDRGARLAVLARHRYQILSEREDLLAFEKDSERREGTAFFVEQKARSQRFGTGLEAVPFQCGWSRQYGMGAAACWLLDELSEKDTWHSRVESGASPTELLIQFFGQSKANLDSLNLSERIAQEEASAHQIRNDIERQVDENLKDGAIRLQFPAQQQIFRSFSPQSIISLGDGRLVHTEFLIVQSEAGHVNLHRGPIVEDHRRNELTFPAVSFQMSGDQLKAKTDAVQLSLTGVEALGDNLFRVVGDKRG